KRRRWQKCYWYVGSRLGIDGDEDVVERAARMRAQVAAIVKIRRLPLLVGHQKRVVKDVMWTIRRRNFVALKRVAETKHGHVGGCLAWVRECRSGGDR